MLCPDLNNTLNLEYIEQNISLPLNYTEGASYDFIIHAATGVVEKTPSIVLMEEIISGTKNILDYAKKCNVKSVINISSGAVYGDLSALVAATECLTNMPEVEKTSSSYGIGKLVSEHYSYLYANDLMKVTSLRCFCFGGEYLDMEHYVLGNFIKKAIKNEDIIVQAGKNIYRSYLATEDLVETILYTMIKANDRKSNYEVYNVGSDEAIAIPELAKFICRVLNSHSKIICPNLENKQVSYYVPNVDKIRKTGLEMPSKLADIILNVQKYYLALTQ
ncbi:MAG: NAD-dependent epimerase/dehydratase [Burkholderiales bacterium]|nr:NAD-dependent epimerase/dehydratase [Burkholderiales bacterium]